MFAEVSLPISSFQTFTYAVPEDLKKEAIVSVRAEVPFGNRIVSGIIVSLINKSSFDGQLKSIIKIVKSHEKIQIQNQVQIQIQIPCGPNESGLRFLYVVKN